MTFKMMGILLLMLAFLIPSVSAMREHDTDVGYEFLDGGDVLNIWNTNDDYFFEYPNMIQLSNHYEEYWTHNIVCLGYETAEWNYLCTDTLPIGWEIETDNETYVRALGSKTLNIGSKSAMVNWTYNLYSYDTELNINLAITNVGSSDITNPLRFGWGINDIKIDNTYENDKITFWINEIQTEEYWLNETLDITKTQDDLYYPYFRIYDNSSLGFLKLRWQYVQDYKVFVKSTAQYNSPVSLMLQYDNGIDVGQTRQTNFYWIDAIECYAMWGDEFSPAGNYPSYTNFSDGNSSWGMTCHIDPVSTACPLFASPDPCVDNVADTGHLACRIQKRTDGGSWVTSTESQNDDNCGDNDGAGNVYARLTKSLMNTQGDLIHNNKTDYRCQVGESKNVPAFPTDRCDFVITATDLREDYWLNNNTPIAQNVSIVSNFNASIQPTEDIFARGIGAGFQASTIQLKYPIFNYLNVYEVYNALPYFYIFLTQGAVTNDLQLFRVNNQTWDSTLSASHFNSIDINNETNGASFSSVTVGDWTYFDVLSLFNVDWYEKNNNFSLRMRNPIYNTTAYFTIINNNRLRIGKDNAPSVRLFLNSTDAVESHPYLYIDYWNYTTNSTMLGGSDLRCVYNFTDLDSDSENTSLLNIKWYQEGVVRNDLQNYTIVDSGNVTAGDEWVCCAKVIDDVFETGNEEFVCSDTITTPVSDNGYQGSLGLSFITGAFLFLWLGYRMDNKHFPIKMMMGAVGVGISLIGIHTFILLYPLIRELSLGYEILTILIPVALLLIVLYFGFKVIKGAGDG